MQNVSLQALTPLCADVVFLKGLYFEKIKDKNNMFGFSLYSESQDFRKKMLFAKDESQADQWLKSLVYHC